MTDPHPADPADRPDADDLVRFAVRLATGAAEVVRAEDPRNRTGQESLPVDVKSTNTDLVTAVDRASERWLVEQVRTERPGDGVLGEEGGERAGTTGVRWVVDPIDGTVNFVLGLPVYAVSVAAEVDGVVVAGAVCNPATGETFHARLGGGAWSAGRRLHGPRPVGMDRAVVGTGFSYDRGVRTRQGAVAAGLLGRVADLRRIGSAALDLCWVASGQLDAFFEAGLNPWDYSAGALIAAEAGCVVSGLRGEPASSVMTLAAGPAAHADLAAALDDLGADRVRTG